MTKKKRGRPPKYKNEAERQAARAARRKSSRKPQSVASILGAKIEAATEAASDALVDDELPTPKGGEPFADLPPLDLPSTSDSDSSSSSNPGAEGAASSETEKAASDEKKEEPKPDAPKKPTFETKELAKMAEAMIYDVTVKTGAIAAAAGFFAWGEDMARIAGQSAALVVMSYSAKMDAPPEEVAAYIVLGITGTNAVQAFRAYKAEQETKKAVERKPDVQPVAPAVPQHAHANGSPVGPARRPDQPLDPKERLRLHGSVV